MLMIYAGRLSDGRLQVWATKQNGHLESRWKVTIDPNSQWTAWSAFPVPGDGVVSIGGNQLEDGRIQLFAVDNKGQRWSCWKETADPNSGWTSWSLFS